MTEFSRICTARTPHSMGRWKVGAAIVILGGVTTAPVGLAAARADTRQDVVENAMRCSVLEDDRQWLDCFYGSAQPMRAKLGLPSASEAQIRLSGGAVAGGSAQQASAAGALPASSPEHVSAKLTRFMLDSHGLFTVVLSNGEVWRQLSGDTTVAHWNSSKSMQYIVAINPGALGSYNLQVIGQPERYKVERLR